MAEIPSWLTKAAGGPDPGYTPHVDRPSRFRNPKPHAPTAFVPPTPATPPSFKPNASGGLSVPRAGSAQPWSLTSEDSAPAYTPPKVTPPLPAPKKLPTIDPDAAGWAKALNPNAGHWSKSQPSPSVPLSTQLTQIRQQQLPLSNFVREGRVPFVGQAGNDAIAQNLLTPVMRQLEKQRLDLLSLDILNRRGTPTPQNTELQPPRPLAPPNVSPAPVPTAPKSVSTQQPPVVKPVRHSVTPSPEVLPEPRTSAPVPPETAAAPRETEAPSLVDDILARSKKHLGDGLSGISSTIRDTVDGAQKFLANPIQSAKNVAADVDNYVTAKATEATPPLAMAAKGTPWENIVNPVAHGAQWLAKDPARFATTLAAAAPELTEAMTATPLGLPLLAGLQGLLAGGQSFADTKTLLGPLLAKLGINM